MSSIISKNITSSMSENTHHRRVSLTDIWNGARCGPYSWSQSREDLQVRVRLKRPNIRYEDVNVVFTKQTMRVDLNYIDGSSGIEEKEVLVEGKLEYPIDQESACWLIEHDDPSIVVYVDKSEQLWWKQLFVNEQAIEIGPKNRTMVMDHLDDGSRMMIDKLIIDQRNKLLK